jgi:hypothetical protein
MHVFLETNWVVASAAPPFQQVPAAAELANRALELGMHLHIPSICFSEAVHPLGTKFRVRHHADTLRQYLLWARPEGSAGADEEEVVVRRVLDRMESSVREHSRDIPGALNALRQTVGLDIFDLDQEVMTRCTEYSFLSLGLKPFDQMILAATIVKSERLIAAGERNVAFCSLDSDLQPWDSKGNPKFPLVDIYDAAGVWVYRDFTLESPEKREDWRPDLR